MNEATLEKMKAMKLLGMVRAFTMSLEADKTVNHTADELLEWLINAEWDDRSNRKQERGIKNARFRYKAMVEQISFADTRQANKNQILRLADCAFIERKENVLITGSTGIGKSYIASAIGHQACSLGYKVLYEHSAKLFSRLKLAKADGSYLRELVKMEKQDLLIIDDFGMQPLDQQSRAILMEVIEDRHGKRSSLFTSQVPVQLWYEVIGEKTIADAILDRIIHDAHRLELQGDSLRKRKPAQAEELIT
jgi:DNA replication protein DnaC